LLQSGRNLFVADNSVGNIYQGSVYKYKPDGSRVTIAVLNPGDRPADLALDSMGNLYMAELGGNIYRYNLRGDFFWRSLAKRLMRVRHSLRCDIRQVDARGLRVCAILRTHRSLAPQFCAAAVPARNSINKNRANRNAFPHPRLYVNATHYAWKQNDEVNLYNGKRAGDEWLKAVVENAGATVLCPKIPEQFKDLNDWTRAGATSDDLRDAMVEAEQAAAVEAQEQADKLALLLNSICAFLSRYVVFQMPQQAQVLALWIVHCWVLGAFDYTPYLHVRSPEKQCGKSRLLDCLVLLVLKAWLAILPSEAVLFRKIEKDGPTLLLDEVDGIFSDNGKDEKREALRSLLNAGFERVGTSSALCWSGHKSGSKELRGIFDQR